jgi:hypothetical protein
MPAPDPVLKKLRFPAEGRACVLSAPDAFRGLLKKAPKTLSISESLDGQFDLIQTFATKKSAIVKDAKKLRKAMGDKAILWVCYPKAKQMETDLNRDILREALLEAASLEAVSLVAIDDTWSALRFKAI